MADLLTQRRQWFSFFPEGTLEFLVVTRVLSLLLMTALMILPGTQRPAVIVALAAMVWFDYALLMWWLVQVAGDLHSLFGPATVPDPSTRNNSLNTALILAPSFLVLLAVAPWPPLVLGRGHVGAVVEAWARPMFAVLYLASLPLALSSLRRIGAASRLWALLLLVPIVHWFALHRLLKPLHQRVRDRAVEQRLPVSGESGAGAAATGADVLLIISAMFWLAWGLLMTTGQSRGGLLTLVQLASIGFGGLFAITEVAALEYLQKRFVALVRRAAPSKSQASETEPSST